MLHGEWSRLDACSTVQMGIEPSRRCCDTLTSTSGSCTLSILRTRHALLAVGTRILRTGRSPVWAVSAADPQLERIQFNNPGLVVDLGVGLWAWPLPMDYDQDGDWDLVVVVPGQAVQRHLLLRESGGSRATGQGSESSQPSTISHQPVFKPGVRIADGPTNVQVSFVDGKPRRDDAGEDLRRLPRAPVLRIRSSSRCRRRSIRQYERYRANQWRLVDFDGDGDLDVIIGIEIWDDYGWDDAWDEDGNWKNGPLHGYVYLVENVARGQRPRTLQRPGRLLLTNSRGRSSSARARRSPRR